MPQCHS